MSGSADTLAPFRAKVERAKHHVDELAVACRALIKSGAYGVAPQNDPNGTHAHVVTRADPVPAEVSIIVGDVAHNLRSALDHLAHRLVTVGRGSPPAADEKTICFPFAPAAKDYESVAGRAVKGATNPALDALRATKPYPGGNDLLASIRSLNDVDKHRVPLLVGSAFSYVDIASASLTIMPEITKGISAADLSTLKHFVRPADRMFPLKVGDKLLSGMPGEFESDIKVEFGIEISLGEPDVLKGREACTTLRQLADLVDHLIADFAPLLI